METKSNLNKNFKFKNNYKRVKFNVKIQEESFELKPNKLNKNKSKLNTLKEKFNQIYILKEKTIPVIQKLQFQYKTQNYQNESNSLYLFSSNNALREVLTFIITWNLYNILLNIVTITNFILFYISEFTNIQYNFLIVLLLHKITNLIKINRYLIKLDVLCIP